ncbi:MAG: 30S ribosomal protein S20 [Chlamydiia bacterium]|nr:30S ribosomal protein S20 [Chlamydiia bacterium]
MATKKDGKKAKRPTADKRMIQNEKRRVQNKNFRSKVKTAIKAFDKAAKETNTESVQSTLSAAHALLDKAAKRGIFKLNKTRRTKSRLALRAAAIKA